MKKGCFVGFCTFLDLEDAIKARKADLTSFFPRNKKFVVNIRPCCPDPSVLEGGLLVQHFPSHYTALEMNILFEAYGPVKSFRIVNINDCPPYAYVRFDKSEFAYNAVGGLHGRLLENNKILSVKRIRDFEGKISQFLGSESFAHLLIRGFDMDTTPRDLEMFLSDSGVAGNLSITIAKNDNEVSNGYGYLHFENCEDGYKAFKMKSGKFLGAKRVFISPIPRLWYGGSKVFVQNVSKLVTKEGLRDLFSQCGFLSNFKFEEKQGYSIIPFSTTEEAVKAVKMFNNKSFQGNRLKVHIVNMSLKGEVLTSYINISHIWVISSEGYLFKIPATVFQNLHLADLLKLIEDTSENCAVNVNMNNHTLKWLIQYKNKPNCNRRQILKGLTNEMRLNLLFGASFLGFNNLVNEITRALTKMLEKNKTKEAIMKNFPSCKNLYIMDCLTKVEVEAKDRIESLLCFPEVHRMDDEVGSNDPLYFSPKQARL